MKKDPLVFLQHILKSVEQIEKEVENFTFERFSENITIQDAVVRRLEIIGEAVKNLPINIKDKYPEVPWLKIAAMRNKLIHEYFAVDIDLVWSVVKDEFPTFKKEIKKIIKQCHNL